MSEKTKKTPAEVTATPHKKPRPASGSGSASSSRSGSASSSRSGPAFSRTSGPMDLGLIEEMVKLMSVNDLSTLEIRDGDKRILLKRGPDLVAASAQPSYASPQPNPPAAGSAASAPGSAAQASTALADADAGLIPIKSPMVGTFYAAASADTKPFVQVGTVINEETDVAIIEAMKVFNNIKAEVKGTVSKILVQNGATVEFGQVLFLVRP